MRDDCVHSRHTLLLSGACLGNSAIVLVVAGQHTQTLKGDLTGVIVAVFEELRQLRKIEHLLHFTHCCPELVSVNQGIFR